MVRETRYLLVGNLPENVTEEEISEYFKRFSKIQSVKIHSKKENEDHVSATVAFADIKSASKAHSADNSIRGKVLTTSYSEGSATGSVVKRTLDEPRPSFSANRPSSFPRKGPEDGEVYEGRDYYTSGYSSGYTAEYERGRPRERFQGRGGFKQFDRGGHQWSGSQRRFGEVHRSNSSSDRDAFEKPKVPQSPARSLSQTSKKSGKMKRKQSNSTSRSRSASTDSSSSSSYSDSSSDSSRSRSRSGSRSTNRASRSKLPSTGFKSGRSRSQGSNASENTETTEGGNRPHGIRITNLPARSSDTSLRDGLFHEYKKYGKVNAVQVSGNGDGRFAVVSFKKSEDARKALDASQEKRFFGTTIRVSEHEGIDVDDAEFRPPEAELDEHHPKATRTLFVGNLEKEITMEELKDMFSKYGEILDIDVKRQGAISAYSFIQFTDIRSVVKALRALDGETMGGMKLKLGFGKSMPTNCVWVDNLADTVQENFLFRQFARYGPIANMVIDRERGKALIFYNTLENAQFALNEMRNRILNGQKIQIDFASRDCQTDFYDKMEKSGQLKPGQRSNFYQRQTSEGGQWTERGRGKFPFVRGSRGFRGGRGRWNAGRGYSKEHPEEYYRQRSYEEYSQGGGTPYSEGDFESDLHAYRTQRERQRSCSPDQYSDDMYSESYREYKSRYADYPGSPSSEPEETYDYKPREEMYYKERYVIASREGSPNGSFQGRSWSHSPTRTRTKDSERNTPPTPLGGDDTRDFSSREHSPSEMDSKLSEYKRSGKDDFDITEADIQELRTSKYSSAHRKESLSRSEERYARKRSYDDSFSRDSISKEEASICKLERQLSHGSHNKLSLSDSKKDLFQKMKKIQSEISGKISTRNPQKEAEGICSSNSSDSDKGSLTEGELSKLVQARQLMLRELDTLDTNNSDTEHLDLDSAKKLSKRPRLDPWSGKRLQSELGSVVVGSKKDKSYDVSQSFRKQMEALRKNEEKSVKDDSVRSKKNDIFNYEDEKDDFMPQGLLSPKDVPSAFVKKRKKTDVSEDNKHRTYRHKRENEDERMSSDNDESAKNVLRTDSVASIGSIRRVSSGHSSPRTPITGHLSLENIEHRLSESEQSNTESQSTSSLLLKKDSKRRNKEEHSSPVIIPLGDDNVISDIHDPRVPKEKCKEDFCLPLPKFAEYTPPVKLNSPHSDSSGGLVKEDSPCFSPPSSGSKNESPQMSPNDTTSEESQTLSNPERTYIPEEVSNEPSAMETLENTDIETDKPPPIDPEMDEALSDSDHNEDFSLEERIRKLDEKLNQLPTTQPSKLASDTLSSSTVGINISSSNPPANIYSKFKIKKRQDSVGICVEETEKGEKPSSEIVKTMLNRSSIFDLDSKRLEQINEKYSPNVKSVVSSGDDSPKNVTLRTKAEAKEMPLSTLPGSLAGRLGNGSSSFPTLSVNTQPLAPLSVKIDDKTVNSYSPGSNSLKGYPHDQNSQENKTAESYSFNSDNRIFNVSERLDIQNNAASNYSPRFTSIDNGLNKTRTIELHNESSEKSDSHSPPHSNSRDPRLNSKREVLCKRDLSDKTADDRLDLNNKKLDSLSDNKFRTSPPKNLDINFSKDEVKVNSGIKSEVASDSNTVCKDSKTESNEDEHNMDMDVTNVSLLKRKSESTPKKDKTKSNDGNSASPSDLEKDISKTEVRSGSESPDSKKPKLSSSPDKDNKSETNSPTQSDKSDKLKKDNDKKNKESKKKDKSEGDSVNKDKGFNDRKDKDHDGDKTPSTGKNGEQSDNKTDDKSLKSLEGGKKESSEKSEGKESEKPSTKKESDKKSEHSNMKKEKKNDSSTSKKSTDSSHKKGNKSAESKTKDKVKSSHKTKDSSKTKDEKGQKEGHTKSQTGKVSKSGSTEKVDQVKDDKNNQAKENVGNSDDKKDTDTKINEKSLESSKDKSDKSAELVKDKEKSSEISKEKEKSTEVSKDKPAELSKDKNSSSSDKPKDKSTSENKHKTKTDSTKTKDKNSDTSKHKSKGETTDQHKSKSSHDKKSSEKTKHKDSSKTKEKTANSETGKTKDKSSESKSPTTEKSAESENIKSDSKPTDIDVTKATDKSKSADDIKTKSADDIKTKSTEDVKTKSVDDVKNKDKPENGKSKEKAGNGSATKSKEKIEHDKPKSTETASKPKDKTKHSDGTHSKSRVKEEKSKSTSSVSHTDKVKDKMQKENGKKDDDHSKADNKKEGGASSDSKSSASNKTSENYTVSEKKEENGNNQENKSESKSEQSENKNDKSDTKTENSSGNTDSLSKNPGKSDSRKERKKSGDRSKSSSKSSSKKSSSEKKSDSKSNDKKTSKKDTKDTKKEEKTSPKDDKNKKSAKKQEVEFDWSAWMDEPYVSMYDRVKRKSSEKDKEREMQVMKDRFNNLTKSRNKSKHSKYTDSDSDFSHDSDEETDAFEEEKVAKPSKEVSCVHESGTKRKRCVIDTSTSSDDDDSQLFKSFQKSTLNNKDKNKGTSGKSNKHSVNDIYSSDSSETTTDFPPISPAKKKTKKTKKATKKPQVHHDTDSDMERANEKQKKKKNTSSKPKPKSTPKKKPDVSKNLPLQTHTDTHESEVYDIDSDMDIFDRIKLKNQKKHEQMIQPKTTPKRLETTTDDSDNHMFSPSRKANGKKKESKPARKSILDDPLFDTDSDSSFPDLSLPKNCVTKKINHETENKKPVAVTVGTGVIAQTIRSEDLGEKKDLEAKKKEKTKKKSKKNDVIKADDTKKDEVNEGLFEKMENFITQDKPAKHSKKEGKSQSTKDMTYLDEEEINQAEKLVSNMSKLEKPMKHDKLPKPSKQDHEKSSLKSKPAKIEHSFSSETDTEKEIKTHSISESVTKTVVENKKLADEKKVDETTKLKTSKPKKKKHDNLAVDSSHKEMTDISCKKDITDIPKKTNNKIENDVLTKKKTSKIDMDDVVVKKPTSKLDMDNDLMKKPGNKTEKEEGYKIGFGFFDDFPMIDDISQTKKGKKKKEKTDEEPKTTKKDGNKSEEKTPKKKDKKKKEGLIELSGKENGPKLEELVGRLAGAAHNSDVFDFQDEEEDNKPLFADFFKIKEEMTKKAAAVKKDKPEGKKSAENRLSSEEKSDDGSSESHEEVDESKKLGQKVEKETTDIDKTDSQKAEELIKSRLFSPSSDDKIEDPSLSSMFSPKHVKEACKDEANNIMAFASPKGDMGKSDDESGKLGLTSPIKSDIFNAKVKGNKDLVVGHIEIESKDEIQNDNKDAKTKEIILAEKKWEQALSIDDVCHKKKTAVTVESINSEVDINEKTDQQQTKIDENKEVKFDKKEKPEVPEKSREEITLEAISSLQKMSETTAVTPEDNFTEGDLVIDETTAVVETVTEEPELTEQAQNETDLAILSILPLDEKSSQFTEPLRPQTPVVEPQPEIAQENVDVEQEQISLETSDADTSFEQNELVIDTSASQNEEVHQDVTAPGEELVQEKPAEHKEKAPKSRKNQKVKNQADVLLNQKDNTVQPIGQVKDTTTMNMPSAQMIPTSPNMPPHFYGQIQDPKYAISKQVPEIQKPEPYRKTRKQKANALKSNHQVEVPGTFYPPVYNPVDQSSHPANILHSGDASEKENEELMQQYNETDKADDIDIRVSGDEGGNNADKRTRRGRKQQNYKELNSGVHGRNTSPRSRTSPRSPRAGMSPRQALSPLSSPKSELSSPVVKLEKLPFGNKNIGRMDGDMVNEVVTEVKHHQESIENRLEQQNLANSKKLLEEIIKPPMKEGTNIFDFDDNEPELKINTTPLKATRAKKGRRNTQDSTLGVKAQTAEIKNPLGGPNHMVSPLESRWQCKSDADKSGHPPLKLTIALTHSTAASTSTTNSIASVINSATIIDSTIPSIKGKKDIENVTKVSSAGNPMVSSIMSTIASVAANSCMTTAAPTLPISNIDKTMSNVDRIIDDVSKGIFDWSKINEQGDQIKDHMISNFAASLPKVTEGLPKVTESLPMAMQPTKKRHTQNRSQSGEQEMMPPPIVSPPGHEFHPNKSSPGLVPQLGHDFQPTKSSPVLLQPTPASSPYGSAVITHGRNPVHTTSVTAASMPAFSTSQVPVCEPPVVTYSQPRSAPQVTNTLNKPLDMALNMTSRADILTTTAAHSLSTAAVVTQTTTTTMALHSPGTSVVMSAHKPMSTHSGNTTVIAGRTVSVKPPNTEAYLHQMGLHPGVMSSQPPISAHQPQMSRIPENKQAFPPGFLPNPAAFSRPDVPAEHTRPVPTVSSSEKQPQVTSSAPTCVVHPITSSTSKTTIDPKQMHQHLLQSAINSRANTVTTTSNIQPIPPAHMQPSQAQLMEKEQQLRNMGMHTQAMMHLMGQPPHGMPNHIQHKPEKAAKGRQPQKADIPQPNEPVQRPPSAHNQKSSVEQQRPLSAHDNPALLQEHLRNLYGKGFIPPGAIPPQILQMYHQQQMAKMEKEKGHKIHSQKEMVSPGIAHQPSSMFATSISSQSSNPQIKSPAVAQTAPSPHPVFSQPSTSQARPTSPGIKKMNEKFSQNQWPNESPLDARNETPRSRPTSVEPAPSPKHWGYNGSQQPKPAHQQNLDANTKLNQEALRLIEHHKQQEMLRMQEQQDRAKLQEMQRQDIQRREEMIRQQALKQREGIPSTSASTSQQSERDRQTASVPGKPRSSHLPNHTDSAPGALDPRNLHHISDIRGRGQSAFASPSGDGLQGIPPHLYRDPEFQQRLHAAAALRMNLLDPHLYPAGYQPLGLPHPYLGQVGGLPIDHPHMADGRPPSQGGSHGMRSPPPRQAHQAVAKSPAIHSQNRQAPDPPPGEGSLLSLLQRYPVMWQGTLALKNDSCAVQMHVISGYQALVQTALPQQIVDGTCQPLRIAQRMRLEAAQLEGVIKRMQYDKDYCMLLALPCGSDHDDIIYQTRAMSTGFIQYLQQKQAAGIVNIADPASQQPAYVVHIFPPCEFSHETLGRLGFELLHQVRNLSHLLVIITTVA